MLEIKDYGFSAFLVHKNIDYTIKYGNLGEKYLTFNISEASRKALVVEYRQSCFYEFDNIKRKLNNLLK